MRLASAGVPGGSATLRSVTPLSLWLYRAALFTALPLAAPFLLAADRRKGKSRPPLAQRLGRSLPELPSEGVWVQAVSVGEVIVARPIMRELRKRRPSLPIVLSATTATGIATATGQDEADAVVPFPLDLPGPVRRCLESARPRLVVLVETELWPEMLSACGRRDIPVALVNARISDSSFRGYRAIRPLLAPLLAPLTAALAQTEADAERLAALGVADDRIAVTGNVKYDAPEPGEPGELAEALRRLANGRPIVVAGSTIAGEDELVLDAVARLPEPERPFLVLAPRHPERADSVAAELGDRGVPFSRRSHIDEAQDHCDVVLLDTIGELAALYRLATVAVIGGAFAAGGGHNPIEAGRFGVPVATGPHVHNFKVIYRDFLAEGAARTASNGDELATVLASWLADPRAADEAGTAARALVQRHAGATARTVDRLERLLP